MVQIFVFLQNPCWDLVLRGGYVFRKSMVLSENIAVRQHKEKPSTRLKIHKCQEKVMIH